MKQKEGEMLRQDPLITLKSLAGKITFEINVHVGKNFATTQETSLVYGYVIDPQLFYILPNDMDDWNAKSVPKTSAKTGQNRKPVPTTLTGPNPVNPDVCEKLQAMHCEYLFPDKVCSSSGHIPGVRSDIPGVRPTTLGSVKLEVRDKVQIRDELLCSSMICDTVDFQTNAIIISWYQDRTSYVFWTH